MPQLTVPFSELTPRSGPLSYGHANIVRAITIDDDPTRLNLAMVFDAPAGGGPERTGELLHTLVERHESLRTTYTLDKPVRQHVAGSGEFTVDVLDAGDGDPLEAAERTARRLRSVPFELTAELPFRAALVTAGGIPRHLVWVVTHAAMDVAACEQLHTEWTALAAGEPLPPPALQPVDVVELEQSPSIRRLGEGALRYWETQLRRVPQAVFTPSHHAPEKTSWLHPGLCVRSGAAPAQLQTVAERTGATDSAVVLAALVTLLAHRTGHETVVTTSLSGNRVVRKLRGFFGSLAQDALLPVDFDGLDGFDDVVRKVRSAALPAYRSSWFDPTAMWEVIDGVCAQRGISFARDLVFNDMSALASAAGSPDRSARGRLPSVWIPGHQAPLDAAGPGAPGTGESVRLLPAEDIPCRFFACLYRTDDELELTLWIDPDTLDTTEATAFGNALLRLLEAAAEGDVPLKELPSLTDLAPVTRGPGWYRSDHSWIELDAVRALLRDVMGDTPHLVTVQPDERIGHRVVCHLVDPATPEAVHERTLVALPGRVTAIAPHSYLVHPDAPRDPGAADDPAAWDALPVTGESTGRSRGGDTA
ncbi:hypothetical protein DY218_28315 [Streptomyces triticagri]|uniref:Condensation domain-containing protein n=1 Tax=Streptomyces triticagri TaxID=2293568 RepID=A0A372LXH9_9ACTN|nr:condensation domain-containing protein [Streptomyces triticagri]RFU83341.1 hypothetical protein DY218_28315 [Streptomyces triticagri]